MSRHAYTATKARSCDGKRRYADRDAAADAIRSVVNAGASESGLAAYPCRHCGSFHVGHRLRVKR